MDAGGEVREGEGRGGAEVLCVSNYSFLHGGSHPEEIVERAAALGYEAVGLCDRHTLGGMVRAHVAAKQHGVRLVIGARVWVGEERDRGNTRRGDDGVWVALMPRDFSAYRRLCSLLTVGKRRGGKGRCEVRWADVVSHQGGMECVVLLPREVMEGSGRTGSERSGWAVDVLRRLRAVFDDDRLSLAVSLCYGGADDEVLARAGAMSAASGVPLLATGDVLYHDASRRMLQDVVTCIAQRTTVAEAALRLERNGERHLKGPAEMARMFAACPAAVARAQVVAGRCRANLDELRYEYPDEVVPAGRSAAAHLRALVEAGYVESTGIAPGERCALPAIVEHELRLIGDLQYEKYFLTVHDIVRFARSRGILCQGRGAAANSAVCFYLGITSVDPTKVELLFERFVSKERAEPPDIDIDFEHERREEVIQYLYEKYGRDRAALTAVVISFRPRSALRQVGKALGLSEDLVGRIAKSVEWWDKTVTTSEKLTQLGLDARDATLQWLLAISTELLSFPRHLSQHPGGFVLTRTKLSELVPVEPAAMAGRTVIEWDKDDVDAMGMLKVDVLGLGMLSCLRRCFGLVNDRWHSGTVAQWHRGDSREQEGIDVQGPDGLAARDGSERERVRSDSGDAARGDIRPDKSDASCGDIDSAEHCRGVRQAHSPGTDSRLATGDGVAVRTDDRIRVERATGIPDARPGTDRSDERAGSINLGVHSQPGTQDRLVEHRPTASLRHCATASLCLRTIPADDVATFDMICNADTVGVFQIESRAQMNMLPRLRPRTWYDLVIEVAIVRPGPIQGDMVHPYLRRRNGQEAVEYAHPAVERVLRKTLGVPLFQEQCMALAVHAAGFTPGEADQLRRAMAAWKRKGDAIYRFGQKLVDGMVARGIPEAFARRCFDQIKGFSEYGFPESHAASFAHLVYASAYLKCHYPAEFACALLNSQPMGFYQPAQIVRDARAHGVVVRGVDVLASDWDCTVERSDGGEESDEATERRSDEGRDTSSSESHAFPSSLRRFVAPSLRLGMRLVTGLRREDAERIVLAVRRAGATGMRTPEALWRASGCSARGMRLLARADAFASMGLDRQQALWAVEGLTDVAMPLFERGSDEATERRSDEGRDTSSSESHAFPASLRRSVAPSLPALASWEQVQVDYAATGMSLKGHPVSFVRSRLRGLGVVTAEALADGADGGRHGDKSPVAVAGLVLCRQRPGTASGIVFITLEDETGAMNLIVPPKVYERYRREARHSVALVAYGRVERAGPIVHVKVRRLASLDGMLAQTAQRSRDFH
jgi:error-prone DNA polymerase